MLDERRLSVLIRQHGIGKRKDNAAPAKLLAAFLPKAKESKLGRILVETAILLSMHNRTDAAKIIRDAAHTYKIDLDAISTTVKQEVAAKEKAKTAKKPAAKSVSKPTKSSGLTACQPNSLAEPARPVPHFLRSLPVCQSFVRYPELH